MQVSILPGIHQGRYEFRITIWSEAMSICILDGYVFDSNIQTIEKDSTKYYT